MVKNWTLRDILCRQSQIDIFQAHFGYFENLENFEFKKRIERESGRKYCSKNCDKMSVISDDTEYTTQRLLYIYSKMPRVCLIFYYEIVITSTFFIISYIR